MANGDSERLRNLFQNVIVGTEINGKVLYLHEAVVKRNIIVACNFTVSFGRATLSVTFVSAKKRSSALI